MDTAVSSQHPVSFTTRRRQADPWLIGIIALAALFGLIYNGVVMLGYGPDETRHMSYVKLLLDQHTLPRLLPDGSELGGAHTEHPPLYYLYLLPFYAVSRALTHNSGAVPNAPEWHFVRLISMLLCLASLPLIYGIAKQAGRGSVWIARLGTAQVALLPIFGQTCGTLNNDSAALLAVSIFLWLLAVKYPQERGLRSAVALGVCMGLGTLCKASALACDAVALVVYLALQGGVKGFLCPRTWGRIGVVVLLTLAIAGWWHVRSFELYGTWTPLPKPMPIHALPNPSNGILVMMMHPNFPLVFRYANWGIFYTMWSQKDWIPPSVRFGIYLVLAAYCAGAAVSGLVGWLRARKAAAAPESEEGALAERIGCRCPETAFAANWAAVLATALFMHWGWAEGGRYLLPSLSGLSISLARGWRGGCSERALPAFTIIWILTMIALNALTIYWLLAYLNPTYGPHH